MGGVKELFQKRSSASMGGTFKCKNSLNYFTHICITAILENLICVFWPCIKCLDFGNICTTRASWKHYHLGTCFVENLEVSYITGQHVKMVVMSEYLWDHMFKLQSHTQKAKQADLWRESVGCQELERQGNGLWLLIRGSEWRFHLSLAWWIAKLIGVMQRGSWVTQRQLQHQKACLSSGDCCITVPCTTWKQFYSNYPLSKKSFILYMIS